MADGMYVAPVVPGPDGARRWRGARAAAAGEPGHLERLITAAPRGAWPIDQRAADLEIQIGVAWYGEGR